MAGADQANGPETELRAAWSLNQFSEVDLFITKQLNEKRNWAS